MFRCKAVFIASVVMLGDKKFDNLSDQKLMLNASSSETGELSVVLFITLLYIISF